MQRSILQVLGLLALLANPLGSWADIIVTPVVSDERLADVRGITSDGMNLYVTATGGGVQPFGRIYSIATGGGMLNQLYGYNGASVPGQVNPLAITTSGSNLYWIDAQSGPATDTQIFTAPRDGSGPITAIYTGSSTGQPIVDGSGIATDGARLYTADEVQGRVHSLNLDGTGITQLDGNRYGGFFDREHANWVDVKAGVIYIADSGRAGFSDTPPRIQSISTSGGSFSDLYQGTLPDFHPGGLAVGTDTIFLTNGNQILEMPLSGGIPTLLVADSRFGSLGNLTFVNDALYVNDAQAETIWKVSLSTVPEPSSFILLALGGLGMLGYLVRTENRIRGRIIRGE
jgi:hypothetical protein